MNIVVKTFMEVGFIHSGLLYYTALGLTSTSETGSRVYSTYTFRDSEQMNPLSQKDETQRQRIISRSF